MEIKHGMFGKIKTMNITNSILDLEQLRINAKLARERLKLLPKWQLEALEVISKAAASPESIEFLYGKSTN